MAATDIVRGTSTGASNGTITGTSIAVTLPAGTVAGDQLLVHITTRDAMTGWRAPAGWTSVTVANDETTGEGFFYRAKYGTDITGTSWTFDNGAGNSTATKWVWSCVALRGDLVGDFVAGAAQGRASSGTATPTPSITPAVPAHLVAAAGDRITGTAAWTWPSGWVEQTDLTADPGASNNVSSSAAVYNTTPTAAGSYSVTPTTSVTGGIGWAGILAYAVAATSTPVAPTAAFTAAPTSGPAPLTVAFTDTSAGTPTAWSWAFGDGGTSTAQNPSHTYAAAGSYTVTLTASNTQGSNSITTVVTAVAPGTLPGLIDGIEPEAHAHVPPFVDGNGVLYRVTEADADVEPHNTPRMMRSVDGGATWAEVDQANRPADNDLESLWMVQDGTRLCLLVHDGGTLSFHTFNTSDAPSAPDTWVIRDEHALTGLTAGSQQHASMVKLSDGRFRVFFADTLAGTNRQLAYITRAAAGGWSAKTRLTADTDNRAGAVAVTGASDLVHLFAHDYTNRQVRYWTLTSAGVLSSSVRADSSGTNTATRNYNAVCNPVTYTTGGVEVVTALYASAAGVRAITVTGGTVGAEQLVDNVTPVISPNNTDKNTGTDSPVLHLALQGTTVHAIWADAATGDLYRASRPHGGTWTARALLADAPTGQVVQWAYNNVYVRAGATVLGHTYDLGPHADNDSNIYYDEFVLVSPPPPAGAASGSWTFSGAATGNRTPRGVAAGAWVFAGVAGGKRAPKATGGGAWVFAGAAAGKRTAKSSAGGTWLFTGTATGKTTRSGTAAGTAAFVGTATGITARRGQALGSWAFTGAAAGTTTRRGAAAGTWVWAGAAAGRATRAGTATGLLAWSGNATGHTPVVGQSSGTSAGQWTWTGTATGRRAPRGTATGLLAWTGGATGARPSVGLASGTATGTLAWHGVALGVRTSRATAAGVLAWAGAASGTATLPDYLSHVPGTAGLAYAPATADLLATLGAATLASNGQSTAGLTQHFGTATLNLT